MDLQKGLPEPESESISKAGLFNSIFKKKKKGPEGEREKQSIFKSFDQVPESGDLSISLMPEKAVIIPRIVHSRILILITALIVIVIVFAVSWLYVDWHFDKIKNEVEEIDREIQITEAQSFPLLKVRDEVATLEKNAGRAEDILDNHVYWTKFFGLLEKYTTADVYFNDFSADTSGLLRLDSVCRDLISVAKQFVVFSQASDFVKEVDISDVAKAPNGIKATFTLVLVDDVFKR